jgi:preprotein translocase subunit SecG
MHFSLIAGVVFFMLFFVVVVVVVVVLLTRKESHIHPVFQEKKSRFEK